MGCTDIYVHKTGGWWLIRDMYAIAEGAGIVTVLPAELFLYSGIPIHSLTCEVGIEK